MKGLFQCPPRVTPWVMMGASLSPRKGKSFEGILMSIYKTETVPI